MSDSIERTLCTTYSAIAEQFAAALDLLETLHRSIDSDQNRSEILARLNTVFARVALLDSSAAEPRDRLSNSGTAIGRELVDALTRLDTLGVRTRDRIQSAEAALLARMDGLVPALERTQRACRMNSAYGLSIGWDAR